MKNLLTALALIACSMTGVAHATTFGFADSSQNDVTSTHGFNFSGGQGDYSWINGKYSPLGGPATANGYAWSNGGTDLSMSLAGPGTFTFNSVSLYENNVVPVAISGYANGVLEDSFTANLTANQYSTVSLNWSGVDTIVFSNGQRSNLWVTDITVNNAVPEPASLALMGLGLVGFAAVRRQSKK